MSNSLEISPACQTHWLPDDLSLYIGKKTLVKLILEAAEGIDAGWTGAGAEAIDSHAFQPAMMLTLLTYCYATGVHGSADIELEIRRDRMTRYLCAKTYPDLDAIRSFRRQYRLKLKQCLAAVLCRVWELRFCGDDAEPIDGRYIGTSPSRWTDAMPVPKFDSEAEERITRAVRADSMALDV
jgi:transposase